MTVSEQARTEMQTILREHEHRITVNKERLIKLYQLIELSVAEVKILQEEIKIYKAT